MTIWTSPPGRRAPGIGDHLVVYAATLAMTGVAGAAVVMAATLAERFIGPPEGLDLVAVLWVYGINLMRSPIVIWSLLALGVILFEVPRRMGWGGLLPAILIGLGITLSVATGSAETAADALIRLLIGATVPIIWWKIMGLWISRGRL